MESFFESSTGELDSAVTVNAQNRSIETIQNFILPWNKGDRHAFFNRYDNNQYYTDEKENAYGMDIKYDFKLTNQISEISS